MPEHIEKEERQLLELHNKLSLAKAKLKKEFIGIDKIIDKVVDAASSWFLFPHLQERPVVINLWGLTGVGKSSLVARLAELLDFKEKYFHFDLGEDGNNRYNIKSDLSDLADEETGFPLIIAFDEFQHARTINENGEEMTKSDTRIIWQLLDQGKYQIQRFNFRLSDLYELNLKLEHLLSEGVQVAKGHVTTKKKLFLDLMDIESVGKAEKEKELRFVPSEFYGALYDNGTDLFSNPFDVKTKLLELNGPGTIEFIHKVIESGLSPKTIDCSKALIFVMGNLDEAFGMNGELDPDMDADLLHDISLKISLSTIKNALKERFRSEQIARLGNSHVIYPAFGRSTFEKIIEQELQRTSRKVLDALNIRIEFHPSINAMIYEEGVYPTQGVRPVLSTIHGTLTSNLGKIVAEITLKGLDVERIELQNKEAFLSVTYFQKGEALHELNIPLNLELKALRKNKKDETQALTAVHEAGHALVSIALLRTVPEVIFSNSVDDGKAGFVVSKFEDKFISKTTLILRTAFLLGGIAAEQLVFGKEHITSGSEQDIEKATELVTAMLRSCGMGDLPVAITPKAPMTRYFIHDEDNKTSEQASELIAKALALAIETLNKEKALFLSIADHLSEERSMNKKQLEGLVALHSTSLLPDQLEARFSYRNTLKESITEFGRTNRPEVMMVASTQ